jgi:hypothetical protein
VRSDPSPPRLAQSCIFKNVRRRLPPWLLLALLTVICAGIIGAVVVLRAREVSTPGLLARLPSTDAAVLYIDFNALRQTPVMDLFAGSSVALEPEYRAFVDGTGFDYTRDLDSALVAFHPGATFFLLRGRFQWGTLSDYVAKHGGECHNSSCRIQGSTPERNISYFPLHPNVMALAVSKVPDAAGAMQSRYPVPAFEIPADPIWSYFPSSLLKDPSRLPAGMRAFARALEGAQHIVLSARPDGNGMRVQLDIACQTPDGAAALTTQLRAITDSLRSLIAREKQAPNPSDLSGVLTAGTFEQKGQHVVGRWPIQRAFLEAVAGGAP